MSLVPRLSVIARFTLLAVLLALAALGERSAERYFTNGVAYGNAALQRYAPLPPDRYGVNAFLDQDVYAWQLQRDFDLMQAAGISWVRQDFLWAEIEPDAKGNHYDRANQVDAWAKWDRIVRYAAQYHFKLVARLDFAPRWATTGNLYSGRCPTLCPPPNNPQDFADFASAVATRYRGQIAAYQIWNEPNLQHEWAGRPISPAAYTTLLKDAYTAIKAADPDAVVLSAALAPNRGDSPDNMADPAFLHGMYASGARPYFDVLAANAYGLNHAAFDRRLGLHNTDWPRAELPHSEPFTFDRPLLLRQIMAANGDAGKAVWVTEFGWISLPNGWRGNPSPWSQVSASARVRYTVDAWQRAADEWPWMGPLMLWYWRTPTAVDPRDPTPYFAILGQDWQPTDLYGAIKAQATAPEHAATGVHSADDPAAVYGPHGFGQAWQRQLVAGQVQLAAGAPGANMAFRFQGDTLWLRTVNGPQGGEARVTIDNVAGLANALPADARGDRLLDTNAPTPEAATWVEIASGLPLEAHELELEVLPSAHSAIPGLSLTVRGFGVTIEKPAIWSYLKAALAGTLVLLLLWPATALVRRGTRTLALRQSPEAILRVRVSNLGDTRLVLTAWVLVALAFYLSPSFGLSVIAGALLLLLGVVRPAEGVLLVPVAAALEFLPKHLHGSEIGLSEVLIAVCAAGWLVRCYWRRSVLLARGPATALALGLLVVGFLSLFAAEFPRYSFRDYREVILEPVMYFVLITVLLTPRQVRRLVGVTVAGGVAVALAGLAAYASHRGVIATEGVVRLAGIYPSPDNLALYLDRSLAMAGGIALWSSGNRRRLYALACVPLALAIVLTFTKGAWVAVVLTAALAGLLLNRRLLWLAGAAVAVAVAAAALTQARRLVSLFSFGAASTTGRRLLLWRASWNMARDHPVQGVGLDNFLYQYPRYRLPGAGSEPFLSHPHNFVLDFWLSLGALGLAWLAWAIVTIVSLARTTLRLPDRTLRATALGLLASIIIGALHGLVDNSYFLPDLAVLFWLALGGLQVLAAGPVGQDKELE